MKFKMKPVVVEATQWFKNGDHPFDNAVDEDGCEFEGMIVRYYRHPALNGQFPCAQCGKKMHDHGWIDSLYDGHIVCPGDWVVTGVNGEYYPCKPDIFEKTYERAEE